MEQHDEFISSKEEEENEASKSLGREKMKRILKEVWVCTSFGS